MSSLLLSRDTRDFVPVGLYERQRRLRVSIHGVSNGITLAKSFAPAQLITAVSQQSTGASADQI
jgi:hypothetical protein